MKVFRSDKQKDNLARFFWDLAKVEVTLTVVGPFTQPTGVKPTDAALGALVGMALCLCGYLLDGKDFER